MLSWFQVPGADFYRIEISADSQFLQPFVNTTTPGTEFVLRDLTQDVVYYRVAAEKTSGRKGLFSEPAKVDIRSIREMKISGEVQPGVRLRIDQLQPTEGQDPRQKTPRSKTQAKPKPPVDSKKTSDAKPHQKPSPWRRTSATGSPPFGARALEPTTKRPARA